MAIVCLLVAVEQSHSAERYSRGVTATGIGIHLLSQPTNPDSRISNPAGASWINTYTVTAGYFHQWGLRELDMYHFQLVLPYGNWTSGIRFSGFGNDLYSEQQFSLTISSRPRHNLALGIESLFERQNIAGYSGNNRLILSPGILYLRPGINVGAVLRNLYSVGALDASNPPRQFIAGFAILLTPRFTPHLEFEMHNFEGIYYRAGLEINSGGGSVVRFGYDQKSRRIHFGLGVRYKSTSFNSSYDNHPYLGWSHAQGITLKGKSW